jgi:thiol:disulfide interchange protein DsbA
MNCETIDAILDDHLLAGLAPLERQRAAEHVGGCARCAAAWAADAALRADTVPEPAPQSFAAAMRRVAAAPAAHGAARRARAWRFAGAAAAALAVVAVAARIAFVEPEPEPASRPPAGAAPAVAAAPLVAGRDYEVLPGAAARAAAYAEGSKVEVTEFFMWWCSPCYAFEPELVRWEAQAPSHVELERVPALFNPLAALHARAYYTAEALGKLEAMHGAFYDEIHARGNRLDSRAALAQFFERFGVERAAFDAAFDSSRVDARLEQAEALNREYAVRATPSIVVAGRYSTNPSLAGSSAAMLEVVDRLVAESAPCASRCPESGRLQE